MARTRSVGEEPAKGVVRPDVSVSDIDALEREAEQAFNGLRDVYIVRALCIIARELRLLRGAP